MVDDGLHKFEAGIVLFEHSISKLATGGIYVIEDVNFSDLLKYQNYFNNKDLKDLTVDYINLHRPNVPINDNNLIVIGNNL